MAKAILSRKSTDILLVFHLPFDVKEHTLALSLVIPATYLKPH